MTEKTQKGRGWYAPWAWDVEYANDGSISYPNQRCNGDDKGMIEENFSKDTKGTKVDKGDKDDKETKGDKDKNNQKPGAQEILGWIIGVLLILAGIYGVGKVVQALARKL